MWSRDARGRWYRSVDAVGDAFEVLREGWRGTPEEGDIAPGVDASGDVFEVLRGGCGRGTPEEGGIAPGRDSVGGYY